jgi:hypothetical protein
MNKPKTLIPCIGCGALVPDIDGPTFPYPGAASPGCWAVFGEVMAKEYGEFSYPPFHRLSVDAYALQHPGRPMPQTIQSVTVHLISMCCVLERGYDFPRAAAMMRRAIEGHKGEFQWLEPPPYLGEITVLDVASAGDVTDHLERVEAWAHCVWDAWSSHHATIRAWVDRLQGR